MQSRRYPPVEVGVGENLGVSQGSVMVCEREGGREGGSRRALVPHTQPWVAVPTALPLPAPPHHPQTSRWRPLRRMPRHKLPGSLPSPSQGDLFGSPRWEVAVGPTKSRARRWAGSPEQGHVLFQRLCSLLRRSAPAQRHSGPVRRELSRGMEGALAPH